MPCCSMHAGRLLLTANQGSAEGLQRLKNQFQEAITVDLHSKKKRRNEVARSDDVMEEIRSSARSGMWTRSTGRTSCPSPSEVVDLFLL